ncbi:MAG TPA: ABC transporter substrate-binding protein [Gaiella sp.]|uniref:ABC transporter substrate-binding protein n=1 Tax=Gaiella sp. TaxID=2663207 RepID=UPI002D8103C5|nr:ABC transporter substrate-binding protein [Gaiella sp.]HET9288754.1 ABC transporter substrate-binding protein [Gaiella sp.]
MKRFWLVTAVGALAAFTAAMGGSTAYGGSSSESAAAPIKVGAITPLTGPFAPWGLQARAGMALAVNEINRSGGVKGRGQGRLLNLVVADDQSRNTSAAIDGFRRLTQQERVVSIGGIIDSGIGLATSRLAEEARVPLFLVKSGNNDILTPSSRFTFRTCLPAASMVATSVVELAQRRGIRSVGVMIADYAWGQSFKSSLEDAAKAVPNIRFNIQVAPVPTTNFTPYLRAFGDVSLLVGTGHPPGASLILAQAGQLGIKAPVIGAYSPYSLTARNAGAAAYGRWSDFKCMATGSRGYKALAKRYLRTFPQNEFFEDDALAGYAYVKIVAQAIQNVGTSPQAIAAYVHRTTFNIPGYAFPLRWTAWGELDRPTVQFAVLTRGAPPEAGLNTASPTFWPRVVFKSRPLPPYRPPS